MVAEYGKHKHDIHYQSVMDTIMNANPEMFRRELSMCNAMMEILKDRIDKIKEETRNDAIAEGIRLGKTEGIRLGRTEGIQLTKRILRMNAEGINDIEIAEKCMISLENVRDILGL